MDESLERLWQALRDEGISSPAERYPTLQQASEALAYYVKLRYPDLFKAPQEPNDAMGTG